jgi:branched-subunit amino acid ABC-type transport system permease component
VIPILLDGVVQGLQLALLAVGITLIYGLGGVLQLAHGQVAVIAGVAAALLIDGGLHPALASVLGILTAALFSVAMDLSLLRPAYRHRGEERLLLSLVLTLGLSFLIDGFLTFRYPYVALTLRLGTPSVTMAGITLRTASIAVSAMALAAFGVLALFLVKTWLGRAVRSLMQNETGAALCGIDADRTRTFIVGLSGLLAGLAGVSQGLFSSLGPEMGGEFTILALIVAVVGGVRSLSGTFAAGLLLGVVNAFASYLVGTYVTWILLLGAAMVTLLVRPQGLLAYRA